jgi:hypothetical protein
LLAQKPVLGAFVVTVAGCCWLVHKRRARAAATQPAEAVRRLGAPSPHGDKKADDYEPRRR